MLTVVVLWSVCGFVYGFCVGRTRWRYAQTITITSQFLNYGVVDAFNFS